MIWKLSSHKLVALHSLAGMINGMHMSWLVCPCRDIALHIAYTVYQGWKENSTGEKKSLFIERREWG